MLAIRWDAPHTTHPCMAHPCMTHPVGCPIHGGLPVQADAGGGAVARARTRPPRPGARRGLGRQHPVGYVVVASGGVLRPSSVVF